MSTERIHALAAFPLQRQNHYQSWRESLKRKHCQVVDLALPGNLFGYPSPPMSSPPSPTKAPAAPPATATAPPRLPLVPATLPTTQAPAPAASQASSATAQAFGSPFATRSAQASSESTVVTDEAATGLSAAATSPRGGRKSKAHVASACVNCKRAHLSCDVQRPCTRCVASGKQDTCYDVAHKKRGRPRLREEGEFRIEQSSPESSMQGASVAGPSRPPPPPLPPRPMAEPRHRRGESFRSLRSQTSDDSPTYSTYTPSFPPASMLQSPTSYPLPLPHSSGPFAHEVPTAFLDLDMAVLKANRPFGQIMAGLDNIRGRQLADIAAPADNEAFQTIRNRLRAEREASEPAYMPPILHSGEGPVQGVSEADADQITQAFGDQTYVWTQVSPAVPRQTFPARVRLAKAAGIYFIVVTLPSFHPVERPPSQGPTAPSPFAVAPAPMPTPMYLPPRQTLVQSAPPMNPALFFGGGPPPLHPSQLAASQSYPRPQPLMPYQQLQYPQQPYSVISQPASGQSQLPIAEPPTATTPFTPGMVPRQPVMPGGTAEFQLPPIIPSPAAGPSRPVMVTDDEDDGEEGTDPTSPRKRRRMNIGDVLQR